MAANLSQQVHLVGSIGLDTVEDVFRDAGQRLGQYLRRIPDGEPGGRRLTAAEGGGTRKPARTRFVLGRAGFRGYLRGASAGFEPAHTALEAAGWVVRLWALTCSFMLDGYGVSQDRSEHVPDHDGISAS